MIVDKKIYLYIPKRPMNAVSMREAMGSAAIASAEGNAIPSISRERASNLETFLHLFTLAESYHSRASCKFNNVTTYMTR